MEQLGFHWKYFHEIQHLSIFRKYSVKVKLLLKYARVTSTLHEDVGKFLIISRSFLLIKGNVLGIVYRISKHTFYVQQHFSVSLAVYAIKWKPLVQPDRSQAT